MAEILVKRSHGLAVDAARRSVQEVADQLAKDLGARYHWSGDSLRFECPGAKGSIDVTATDVSVSVHLSWLLAAARKKIEHSIEGYLDRYLA